MVNNADLLAMYKEEKEAIAGPLDDFPSWPVWRTQYLEEYSAIHQKLSAEEADRLVESEIGEFDEDDETPSKPMAVKEGKPEPEVQEPVKSVIIQQATGGSKKDKAVNLYRSLMVDGKHPARKDVIDAFIAELSMSKAGASTYHNTVKRLVA